MFRSGIIAPMFLVLVLGCSKGENKTANSSISGEVSFKGKVLKGGSITFHPSKGPGYTGILQADGTYSITDVTPGEMAVTIETESVAAQGKAVEYGDGKFKPQTSPRPDYAKGKAASTEYTKIPEKYSNKNRSGLTMTLVPGRNTKNFDLAD